MRLEAAAIYAKKNGFEFFATTLTISPHKHSETINQIGRDLAQKYKITFIDKDWAKQDGFKITMQMAREHEFYIQRYCGCRFSLGS